MVVENGFHDCKPQPHAVTVFTAGLIRFAEAVKNKRQLLGRNRFTMVFYRDIRPALLLPESNTQC